MINEYMPKAIDAIHKVIPQKVEAFYQKYPYEIYGDLVIRRWLRSFRIREHQIEYQECYDAAMQAYLYSIHRCALCGYEYVGAYIRKVIRIAIICGINIARQNRYFCKANGFLQIGLDDCNRIERVSVN